MGHSSRHTDRCWFDSNWCHIWWARVMEITIGRLLVTKHTNFLQNSSDRLSKSCRYLFNSNCSWPLFYSSQFVFTKVLKRRRQSEKNLCQWDTKKFQWKTWHEAHTELNKISKSIMSKVLKIWMYHKAPFEICQTIALDPSTFIIKCI